jgi:hypothetical protein
LFDRNWKLLAIFQYFLLEVKATHGHATTQLENSIFEFLNCIEPIKQIILDD